MKIRINKQEQNIRENSSLKDILAAEGYAFPCKGQGKCGRCIIRCGELEITERDRSFISSERLEQGYRLACDKLVSKELDILCTLPKVQEVRKLAYSNIGVILSKEKIVIAICDDDFVSATFLDCVDLSAPRAGMVLRSLIGKNSVELFEKYGTARADVLAVAGERELVSLLLGSESPESADPNALYLPADSMYVLPHGGHLSSLELLKKFLPDESPEAAVCRLISNSRLRNKFVEFARKN